MKHVNIATEAEKSDGVGSKELEFVIYAELINGRGLNKATEIIRQRQSVIRGAVPGSQTRVRHNLELDPKTLKAKGPGEYLVTTKAPSKTSEALDEVNLKASSDFFNAFVIGAGKYIDKIRYIIPEARLNGGKCWEIDVFYDKNEQPVRYIKIDFEITDHSIKKLNILPDLDIKVLFTVRAGVYTKPEDSEFVRYFYDTLVNIPC